MGGPRGAERVIRKGKKVDWGGWRGNEGPTGNKAPYTKLREYG